MYQSQQFHTANYRGNQLGHDNYLRADSQSPSTYAMGGQNVTSQYRGIQKPFQPTGFVQSSYGQSNNAYNNAGSIGSTMGTQNYHTANYRGNQQGHDSYLHEDSFRPAQSQFGGVSSLNQSSFAPSISSGISSTFSNTNSSFGQAGMTTNYGGQNQFVSPQSYHTANYRGNQQGHDSYLHEDSFRPAQSQYGIGASGLNYGNTGVSSYSNINANIGTSSFGTHQLAGSSSFGNNSYNQNQFVSPESYHTANYRGNQLGHDNYLNSDSRTPSQSQFGTGMGAGNVGLNSFNSNRY